MKKCANCGLENPGDAMSCQACGTDTFVSSSPEASGGHIISPEEHRFWERMTFRQFAVFIIRLQAVWFLFYAVDVATFLPSYLGRLQNMFSRSGSLEARHAFFWALFRVLWHVVGAVICIRYADRIVSRFVKDVIPKQPPNSAPEPTATAAPVSTKP